MSGWLLGQAYNAITSNDNSENNNLAESISKTAEDITSLVDAKNTENADNTENAVPRPMGENDKEMPSERAARREAFRENNVPTSIPNNYTEEEQYGKNKNLLGPNGEPYHEIKTKDVNGDPVTITRHTNGHLFQDVDPPQIAQPHYHGPKGHIFYDED